MSNPDDLLVWSDFGHLTPFSRRQWQGLNPAPVPFAKFGNKRFYRRSAVEAWISTNLTTALAVIQ